MQAQKEVLVMIKGKRSKRQRQLSPLTIATSSITTTTTDQIGGLITSDLSGSVTPSDSNYSGELTQDELEEEDMANCLILLAKGMQTLKPAPQPPAATTQEVYQCKTCNKSFHSFQALGGHRTSHKIKAKSNMITLEEKMKPISNPNDHSNTILSLEMSSTGVSGNPKSKSRVHECTTCGAEFSSGQALGGHMRRHRTTPVATSTSHDESREVKKPRIKFLPLDLNLPAAPEDDDHEMESEFTSFASKEQVMVFRAGSSLVDYHYY